MEESNPRFFTAHVGVDGDDVDAGFAQRLKCRSQFVFSGGKVAIDHCVLVTTGKSAQVFTPIVLSRLTPWALAGVSEDELDHSPVRFTATVKDLI